MVGRVNQREQIHDELGERWPPSSATVRERLAGRLWDRTSVLAGDFDPRLEAIGVVRRRELNGHLLVGIEAEVRAEESPDGTLDL